MADDLRILIRAELDEALSAQRMEAQLPSISKLIKQKVQVQAEIDEKALQNSVQSQVKQSGKGSSGRVSIPVGIDVQVDTLKRNLEAASSALKKNLAKAGASLDWSKFNTNFERGTLQSLRQAQKELTILRLKYQDFNAGIVKAQPFSAIENLNKYISNLSTSTVRLKTNFLKLRTATPEKVTQSFQELFDIQTKLETIPVSDITERSKEYNKAAKIINDLSIAYQQLFNQERQQDIGVGKNTFLEKQQKALLAVENLKVKYSAFLSDTRLASQYKRVFDATLGASTEKELQNAAMQAQKFEQSLINAGKAGKSMGDEVASNAKKMASWMILGTAIASLIRGFRDVVTNVKEIDKVMTEIKKVTDLTDIAYSKFLDRATNKAVKLGATITDLVKSTADFARLGFSLEQAETLGEVANIYYRVADGIENIEQANSSVISTLKAFKYSVGDSMLIIDKFNEVGRQNCPSTQQCVE